MLKGIAEAPGTDGFRRCRVQLHHVGGIRKQHANAFFPERLQARHAREPAIGGVGIQLEIATVDDGAGRGTQRDGAGVGNAMGDGNPLGFERPHSAAIEVMDLPQHAFGGDVVLAAFPGDQAQGEGCAVDRHGPPAKEVGQRADVILVAMSEQHRQHLVREWLQIGEVRHDAIDARLIIRWEKLTAINKHQAFGAVHRQSVHAELAQAADGHQA